MKKNMGLSEDRTMDHAMDSPNPLVHDSSHWGPPATATSDLSDPLQDVVPHWGDVRVGDHNPAKVGCSTMALLMVPWLKLVNQILVGQLDSSGLLLRRLEENSIRIY